MLKKDQTKSAHLISTTNNKNKGHKRKKNKETVGIASQKKQQKKSADSGKNSCFFYRSKGHKEKHCTNYRIWRVEKSMLLI